ncbi:MAG TPA: FAD/NAD(P)-binding protein [Actinophytocola sp.]|uniref:FAD/NAD(P)-binding protein n=1 Tax=Actinophytocola sp. TaxID=1872138 RepID=UPI002DB9FCC7|nr:FAD/NAD(P)-binding protein [Actinophytocola sp.]HEU5475363.1 FAD/NAD(P)-binding protein [Actinophytocola sp.]
MTTFIPEPHLLRSPRGRDWPVLPGAAPVPEPAAPPRRVDVAIVGAGLAGLAVTSALWHLGVHDVALLDATGRTAGRFFDRVDMLRQHVLRSPYEHHPGVEGYRDCELLDFARLHWARLTRVERREIRMAQAGHRSVVPVDVFEAYCRHVAAIHHADERLWPAVVRAVRPDEDGVVLRADGFELTARFAILCLGEERRAAPESWWSGRRPAGVGYWDEPVPDAAESLVVLGAGLSSAHLIMNGLAAGRRVHWVLRAEAERFQCADVNSSFFRAEGRHRFDGVPWPDRLTLMRRERRASVMFEFRPLLARAEADGRLVVHRGRPVSAVTAKPHGPVRTELADGTWVEGDHLVLALGTTVSTGAALLPDGLAGPRDGWPDLDERTLAYRNASRVFTVGAAAGMVLGPAARNIDGHRVATARVAATVAARLAGEPPVPADEKARSLV